MLYRSSSGNCDHIVFTGMEPPSHNVGPHSLFSPGQGRTERLFQNLLDAEVLVCFAATLLVFIEKFQLDCSFADTALCKLISQQVHQQRRRDYY